MAEVRSIDRDALPIGQAPNVVPVHLLVPEARPSVRLGLLEVIVHRSADGCGEEELPGVRIVVLGGVLHVYLLQVLRRGPVAGEFGVVPVEIADPVGRLNVASPAKVLLDWHLGRPVLLLAHNRLVRHDRELGCQGEGASGEGGGGGPAGGEGAG